MKLLFLLATLAHAHTEIPHILPDAPSREYKAELEKQNLLTDTDGLDPILRAGERNLAWLEFINSHLPPHEKLSFTSSGTQTGIPITSPSEYSPRLILEAYNHLKFIYPVELGRVVFDGAAFTKTPPILTKDYISWSRALDRSYQIAARWRSLSRWLVQLEYNRSSDIRGYYFLRQPEHQIKLKNFAGESKESQTQIRDWLVSLCYNNFQRIQACNNELDEMIAGNRDLTPFYLARVEQAEKTYREFFAIPNGVTRRDFFWQADELIAPFTDPETQAVRDFMQVNVEDEWKWEGGALKLPFTTEPNHPYVRFVPGATPNVNGLGGDRITMNANQPLTEYDAQWTIRHEFGHVLGFPDCYVEFYVRERQSIMNYQIDVDNIMCSRRGHVRRETVEELKRAYERSGR